MKDPTSVESQEETEESIASIAIGLGVSICAVIVRRLAKLRKDTSYADAYAAMPKDVEYINELIFKARSMLDDDVERIFDKMAKANDRWAKIYYKAAGIDQVPTIDHSELSAILSDGKEAAHKFVEQNMRTGVIGVVDADGVLKPVQDAYRATVSRAITDMAAGTTTYQKAVSQAANSLAKDGLKVAYGLPIVEDGRVVYKTRDLYAAMRTNIMDGYRDTMMNLRIAQGREFGADGYEVSAHAPCAPDHLPYQGKQFGMVEWRIIQEVELKSRPIESGANCRHMVYPVIMGVTDAALTPEQLEELKRQSEEQVTVTGLSGKDLTMTRYEATQYQRRIENSLRQDKTRLYLAEQDPDADVKAIRADIRARSAVYKRITEQAGLTTRMERTRAYTID